jgi:lipid-binding SYLF domain-containing protein
MMSRRLSPIIALFLSATGVFASLSPTPQNRDPGKYNYAVVRSQDAAKIVSLFTEFPRSGFPTELISKAKAIAVFPRVTKETLLFQQSIKGYGVICARTGKGWTEPAFYQFLGGGYSGTFVGEDQITVILLFMTKEAISWFEKGAIPLKGAKKVLAGPVAPITEQQQHEIAEAHIIGYIYDNSDLTGNKFGARFKNFAVNPDNNINKPVYGMKGREVLAGKPIVAASVPPGIVAFQEILQKYYPREQ